MKTIQLNILAEDIMNTNYTNPHDCAITRALQRAGLEVHEGGDHIYDDEAIKTAFRTPKDLADKVKSMYKSKAPSFWEGSEDILLPILEPEDFTYSLEVPDNW